MKLYDKIKWVLGISMIFILIVTTNLVDRNNFLRISNSVESIYEDRLVAKDLLLKISNDIHKKEIAVLRMDSLFFLNENDQLNREIESYISKYELTRLTSTEEEFLKNLKNNFAALRKKELEFIHSNYARSSSPLPLFPEINRNIDNLAQIQLSEGRKQLEISRRALDTVDLFTRIEIYVLIFLAILIQIIVIYDPKRA